MLKFWELFAESEDNAKVFCMSLCRSAEEGVCRQQLCFEAVGQIFHISILLYV